MRTFTYYTRNYMLANLGYSICRGCLTLKE